jgi:hypothetical protein
MQFRRSGQRDDRRRRVLSDLQSAAALGASSRSRLCPGAAGTQAERNRQQKSQHYGDAAFMDEQPRLTDLVPRRPTVFGLVLAAGLAVVATLEGLYAWMPRLAAMTSDGRVAAFDLDGEGSLAVWFSSMTLALAGAVAILVFTVRRHRTDDYPGRYRVWLWAAACWFILSIDETSSLHEGFKELMAVVSGTRVFGDGSIWWVTVYLFLLGAVGTRLLIDMRECLLSSAAFLVAGACYALAVVAQLGWILPESGARGVMLEEGAEMVGNLLLLLAMGIHARHVVLDAEGLLPQRRERRKSEEEAIEEDEEQQAESGTVSLFGRSVVVHPPHGVPRPAARATVPTQRERAATTSAATSRPQASAAASEDEGVYASARRRLSKSERKALRKRLMQMKGERERRQRAG